jgi:hypothetical protein
MAKKYLEKLSDLVSRLNIEEEVSRSVELKHFFSGAALYIDGSICVSWSPVGLAFKLPEEEIIELIKSGIAKPLKYFPNGHVKKDYALFANPDLSKSKQWKKYFLKAAQHI